MDVEAKKEELKKLLKIDEKIDRTKEIEKMMGEPSFWGDREKSIQISQELTNLQNEILEWELAENEDEIEKLELGSLLSGKFDHNNAILTFGAGAGGTEAQDWAAMLLRMYTRWAEKRGYEYEILSVSEGEEAGIKSATLRIKGPYAYGYLSCEAGVHRLVRMSPFDADKARHTSFAMLEVVPELENLTDVEVDEKDLRVDVYRSSGKGGQGVNTTDSAVRLTHLPTGIVVTCQNERSQLQNKETALRILKGKLILIEEEKRKKEERELRGDLGTAEWGNQIRSYVLHPYQMIKDLRTEFETSDTQGVLDGEIDKFIEAYLRKKLV